MPRIPYYDVDQATGKHAEFLDKLKPHLNIYRMLANSESGLKGFVRMGNALLLRCELDPRLARARHHPRRPAEPRRLRGLPARAHRPRGRRRARARSPPCATRRSRRRPSATTTRPCCASPTTWCATSSASDKNLKAVQAFLSPGAVVELTLTIGYYMMVCRFLETTGVEGEEGQAEWLKTAKL